jgi:hypothetical protein
MKDFLLFVKKYKIMCDIGLNKGEISKPPTTSGSEFNPKPIDENIPDVNILM